MRGEIPIDPFDGIAGAYFNSRRLEGEALDLDPVDRSSCRLGSKRWGVSPNRQS
jgi:hypothetical protein